MKLTKDIILQAKRLIILSGVNEVQDLFGFPLLERITKAKLEIDEFYSFTDAKEGKTLVVLKEKYNRVLKAGKK